MKFLGLPVPSSDMDTHAIHLLGFRLRVWIWGFVVWVWVWVYRI